MNIFARCSAIAAVTVFSALALVGCGGSGGGTNSAPTVAAVSIPPQSCPEASSKLYFCDDFQAGTSDNWDLTPNTGGVFTVEDTTDFKGATTKALKYTAGGVASNTVIALMKSAVWTSKVNKTDYYVEARIKPLTNGTTGSKFLYMLARYNDATNWYFGGLNVQNSLGSTQVESGHMKAGVLTRPGTKRPIAQDSTWYNVRLVVSGSSIDIYMDGEKLGATITDTAFTAGRIGLLTNNKSFYIDDIKVGDPADKPVLFALMQSGTSTPVATTYAADAGDTPLSVAVNAAKSDGVTADDFTVVSDNPSVVSVAKGLTVGTTTTVTVTPVAAGSAKITFTSGSNPNLIKTIAATIATKYVDSSTTYSLTSSQTYPAPAATNAYADDKLTLTFDSPPTLGTAGTIRIFKKSDDSLVDRINLSGESDSIGTGATRRGVATKPVFISGNTATIIPHTGKLVNGTEYYIGVSDTVFPGATLAGKAFSGIGKAAGWSFTVRSTAPSAALTTITVGPSNDATADYHTIQGALNHVMTNTGVANPVIYVKNGIYNELLYLNSRPNVTIRGEGRTGVVIQSDNYDTLNSGSGAGASGTPTSGGGRSVFLVENCDLLTLDTLTLKSTHLRARAYSNQAEVIYFKSSAATGSVAAGNHRLIAKNANFYSEQDTLQLQGYTWFYDTKVSGNVDFIWGNNNVSVFENSVIEMIGDSQYPATEAGYENGTGGYIMQARTKVGAKGFVFLNSSLTYADGPAGVKVAKGANAASYLARAQNDASWEDNIAYINCKMDTHIAAKGWADTNSPSTGQPNPNPSTATVTKGWREYGSMDMSSNPLVVTGRSATSLQLSAADLVTAGLDSRANMFSAISWSPAP